MKSRVKIEKMEENYLELSRKVFSTLSPREEKIIRLRELEGYTLEMIGFKVNLTSAPPISPIIIGENLAISFGRKGVKL